MQEKTISPSTIVLIVFVILVFIHDFYVRWRFETVYEDSVAKLELILAQSQ